MDSTGRHGSTAAWACGTRWELHFKVEDGLALWDALYSLGVTPVGVETYANSRRMEKSLRLQNADLLTEYNLLECDLARPKV